MRANARDHVQLGELVAAVFDAAAQYSDDPREVACLATKAVQQLLRRMRGRSPTSTPTPYAEAITASN